MADKSKGQVLIVTADQTLVHELSPSLTARGFSVSAVANAREAAMKIGTEEVAAVVADQTQMPALDREGLSRVHKEKNSFTLIFMDSSASLSPEESVPLRKLFWPVPPGFADQVQLAQKPTVFLVDPTLFLAKSMALILQQSGIEPVILESAKGLADFLLHQMSLPEPEESKPKSIWAKLSGKEDSDQAPARLGSVMVVRYSENAQEAERLDAGIRKYVPQAICYFVSSEDPLRAALKAVREGQPAYLLRDKDKDRAGRIAAILDKDSAAADLGPKEKERILLLDNNKMNLEVLCSALMGAGYEVVPTRDAEEALKLGMVKGSFHLAALGTAMTQAKLTGPALAEKLKKNDPDIHFVLMVDPGPLMATLQAIAKAAESGIDAVLPKPIEPDRSIEPAQLIASVKESLRKRALELKVVRQAKEIEEKNRQLQQVNGFQTKFFAMVAHDVKNPLAAIMGYAEILAMKLKDMPNELNSASHIYSAAKALNLLISDLVDLAAIESGKLRVQLGPLDLGAVVGEVQSRIEVVAVKRKIRFRVEIAPALPPLSGDPQRLGQVIQNLCTNAIQYTKEGGAVTLRVDVAPEQVVVGVQDTGIGISKADLPRVFERFFQTEQAQQMRKAGFGLGLKISREIVQMHGGDIGVESELGVGSRFFFTLPVKKKD